MYWYLQYNYRTWEINIKFRIPHYHFLLGPFVSSMFYSFSVLTFLWSWRGLISYFVEWPSIWACPVFSHEYIGIMHFRQEEVLCPTQCIISGDTWCQLILLLMRLTIISWGTWCWLGFSNVRLLFSPSLYNYIFIYIYIYFYVYILE